MTIPDLPIGNPDDIPDVFYLGSEIGIDQPMTIVGAGENGAGETLTILDGDPQNEENRAFNITGGVVEISDLTIQNGRMQALGDEGGAIRVASGASLTLADAVLKDNSAESEGGAVFNAGTHRSSGRC